MAKTGRGRPVRSQIRQNIIEILYFLGSASGYDIYKLYKAIFPKVTLRSIYYNLRKGTDIGEFRVEKTETVRGEYSWGPEAEKTYYKLGPEANPRIDRRVKEYIERLKKEQEPKEKEDADKKSEAEQ
ncbi:MAG: hypothetical protein R6U32_04115 [Candidatus Woesearchaeota archaeon]